MKDDTKELIEYMYDKFADRIAITRRLSPEQRKSAEAYNTQRNKIQKFLKSLPEIEEKLCFGGYIQDSFEKPCCNGDSIKDKVGEGVLYWSKCDFRFYIKREDGKPDLIQVPFVKVEL